MESAFQAEEEMVPGISFLSLGINESGYASEEKILVINPLCQPDIVLIKPVRVYFPVPVFHKLDFLSCNEYRSSVDEKHFIRQVFDLLVTVPGLYRAASYNNFVSLFNCRCGIGKEGIVRLPDPGLLDVPRDFGSGKFF